MLLGVAAIALQSCVVQERDRFVSCGRSHRLQIVDLDVAPDPIAQRQRIDQWRVRLRADASGECQTVLRIQESVGKQLVAEDRVFRLRPGMNDIVMDPAGGYGFSQAQHCYQVIADIEGTRQTIDAARDFCARQRADGRWSMR